MMRQLPRQAGRWLCDDTFLYLDADVCLVMLGGARAWHGCLHLHVHDVEDRHGCFTPSSAMHEQCRSACCRGGAEDPCRAAFACSCSRTWQAPGVMLVPCLPRDERNVLQSWTVLQQLMCGQCTHHIISHRVHHLQQVTKNA